MTELTPAQVQAKAASEAAGSMLVEYTGMRAMVGDAFFGSPMMVTPKISQFLSGLDDDAKTLLIVGFMAVAHQLAQEGLGYRQQCQSLGLVA